MHAEIDCSPVVGTHPTMPATSAPASDIGTVGPGTLLMRPIFRLATMLVRLYEIVLGARATIFESPNIIIASSLYFRRVILVLISRNRMPGSSKPIGRERFTRVKWLPSSRGRLSSSGKRATGTIQGVSR